MKTKYIVPATAVVNVATQHIMAGSPFKTNSSGDVTEGQLQSGNATGAALSRGSIWDDEEDE